MHKYNPNRRNHSSTNSLMNVEDAGLQMKTNLKKSRPVFWLTTPDLFRAWRVQILMIATSINTGFSGHVKLPRKMLKEVPR